MARGSRFELAVDLREDMVLVVIRTTSEGTEDARIELPIQPALARALASKLLGAAKAVDPAGHDAVIAGIREVVAAAVLGAMPAGRPQ